VQAADGPYPLTRFARQGMASGSLWHRIITHLGGATMPISVTCPACAASYRVADSAAGKAIKCKKCGDKVPIPAGKNGSAAKTNGTATAKKGGAGKIVLIVGGLLAASCLLCTGVGGFSSWWFFIRTPRPTIVVNDASKDAFKDLSKDLGKDLAKEWEKAFKDMSKGFK
jgi:predicted Zn finger-like uncharacterized protein